AAARRFIERHFGEGDLAAVVHTSGAADAGQNLTGDRRLLLAAVDRFTGRKLPSSTLSRIEEYRRTQQTRQQGDPVADPDEMERAYNARASLDTLKSVSEWLAGLRGRRKAVLFLSEGIDYNLYDQITNKEASAVLDSVRQATAAAAQANGRFYRIDRRGVGGRSGYSPPHVTPARPPTLAGHETPAALAQLINSPLPRAGLPMQMQATAFQGQGGKEKAVLTLEVAGSGFRFAERDGAFHDTLELAIVTVDQSGKTAGTSQKVQLDLKPRSRQLVEATGFRVLSALDIPPGRYQIRIAGRALNADTSGSVFYDLDVPEFGKQPLALSGLVLTSSFARLVPTAGAIPLLKDALPGPPTATRVFYAFDTL